MKLKKPRKTRPLAERFWSKVKKTDGCWLWTGTKVPRGYGAMSLGVASLGRDYVHRISYRMHIGPIPRDYYVCHRCDNPSCVRPDHLFVGSGKDNMADMFAKGRQPDVRGTKKWSAKLTDDDVLEIRARYVSGNYDRRSVAAEFGVSPSMISSIIHRRFWRHI